MLDRGLAKTSDEPRDDQKRERFSVEGQAVSNVAYYTGYSADNHGSLYTHMTSVSVKA